MKKRQTFKQTLDILSKIFVAFFIVFILYKLNINVDVYAYNYFTFPLVSIIVIFICGINVGISLERIKDNKSIGFFTRINSKNKKEEKTEFVINEKSEIITSKKILKDSEKNDKVHIKIFNYDDIIKDEEKDI